MNHDKLLNKLLVMDANESEQTRLSKTTQALRLIVELHRPRNDEANKCEACNLGVDCPTIQAVEKGLL